MSSIMKCVVWMLKMARLRSRLMGNPASASRATYSSVVQRVGIARLPRNLSTFCCERPFAKTDSTTNLLRSAPQRLPGPPIQQMRHQKQPIGGQHRHHRHAERRVGRGEPRYDSPESAGQTVALRIDRARLDVPDELPREALAPRFEREHRHRRLQRAHRGEQRVVARLAAPEQLPRGRGGEAVLEQRAAEADVALVVAKGGGSERVEQRFLLRLDGARDGARGLVVEVVRREVEVRVGAEEDAQRELAVRLPRDGVQKGGLRLDVGQAWGEKGETGVLVFPGLACGSS